MVTKKEIEQARNTYWLKEAQKQLGSHIKSLNQVTIVPKQNKPKFTLGEKLVKLSNKYKHNRR